MSWLANANANSKTLTEPEPCSRSSRSVTAKVFHATPPSLPFPLPTLLPLALAFASQFAYKKSQVAWANASHTGRMRNARITHSEQATAMRLQ